MDLKQPHEPLDAGVLIIGAGAAGLRTAIELAQRGHRCLVVGKRKHGDAHTKWAAGGINASLGSLDAEDRWEIHAADTLREGHFVCDPVAVELLCRNAPARVLELHDWGCPFDLTDDGQLNQRYFGAQSFRRTCFVGDTTGEAVLATLVRKAAELSIPWRDDLFVTRILIDQGRAVGALGLDLRSRDVVVLRADAVVLAAGGATSLYRRTSSRSDENTGDAMALALEAGAALRDMEFVQFHPTGMIRPPQMEGRLVTEAVRGEGGRLFNANGERFMERYSPEQMELDARDVVARALYEEIQAGRGTEDGGVLLDISYRDADFIRERLPQMYAQFLDQGIDITRSPMEVAPTAHYVMGGVQVDFRTGATARAGFFAVGEGAGGLHGANRLGGNSLAETVVFGEFTGAHLADGIDSGAERAPRTLAASLVAEEVRRLSRLRDLDGTHRPAALIAELRELLWTRAGIVRSGGDLREGLDEMARLRRRSTDLDVRGERLVDALNLQMMLQTAETILTSALLREESRGAHYRKDAPETVDEWQRTIVLSRTQEGPLELRLEPVAAPSEAVRAAVAEDRHLDYHYLE
jgi:succinate dehydrogenase / fumarate reductase, flavoprotein subunit